MLIGITGKMGSGKTLSMTILATFLSRKLKVPLFSNYEMKNSIPLASLNDLWKAERAIMAADELHISMDSRGWKDNIKLSHFITQTRKKNLIFLYTTQNIGQVDLRVRQNTDIVIYCEKKPSGHWLQFIDWGYKTIGRKYLIKKEEAKKFYNLYDTLKVVSALR